MEKSGHGRPFWCPNTRASANTGYFDDAAIRDDRMEKSGHGRPFWCPNTRASANAGYFDDAAIKDDRIKIVRAWKPVLMTVTIAPISRAVGLNEAAIMDDRISV